MRRAAERDQGIAGCHHSVAGRGEGTAGFSLVELLVATLILAGVLAVVFASVHPSHGAFRTQLEASDVQQRLRVAADAIAADLRLAGAGLAIGTSPGPLLHALAPVMPHRIGKRGGEAGVYREDAVSVLHILHSGAQGTLRLPDGREALTRTERTLMLDPRPHCRPDAPLCGFTQNTRALLFDRSGAWDLVTVTGLMGDRLEIAYDGSLSATYPAGARLAAVSARTFYLQADVRAGTFQLRRYDGFESDLPLVDDVVAVTFEYFGVSEPPRIASDAPTDIPASAVGLPRRHATYGPGPPAPGTDDQNDTWGPGENCLFSLLDDEHVPRLPELGNERLVRLDPAWLTDGPWCPDDRAPHRFDADLLRIRRVQVTLRVQAAAALRGPAGPLFRHAGTSAGGGRLVPDLEVRFDITPSSLLGF